MKIPTYQQQQELVLKGYAKVSTDGIFDTGHLVEESNEEEEE